MTNDIATTTKYLLTNTVQSVSDVIRQMFCRNPGKDFTRTRKMTLENFIFFLLRATDHTLNSELMIFHNFDTEKCISRSAFCQLRQKVQSEGIRFLLSEFTSRLTHRNKYKGNYTLVAVDGSDVIIPYDPSQPATFNPPDPKHSRGYNSVHLNALYNLSDGFYLDAVIGNGQKEKDERDAFYRMADRYPAELMPHTIFMADRGYSGYNSFAHVIERNGYFVFRVKDKDTPKSILRGYTLPETEEFDMTVDRFLVKGACNSVMKKQKDVYHYLHKDIRFDFIDPKSQVNLYYIKLRITRIKISDDTYECLISNLPETEFSVADLKELYHLRWGIETSFLELKYNIGLTTFHSRKLDFVLQETFAAMILFNFCSVVIRNVKMPVRQKKLKHKYAVNFSDGVTVCREFLNPLTKLTEEGLQKFLLSHVHAVSPGRHYPRNIQSQCWNSFQHRS